MNWTLDQLKSQLGKRTEVKAWVITQEHVRRRERYFLLDSGNLGVDQDRDVHTQNVQLNLFVHLDKPGRQGEVTMKLFTGGPLEPQIDTAIAAALTTDHQAWDLPKEIPSKTPQRATSDPRMGEDIERVVGEMTDKIRGAVQKKRSTAFNSAELFLSVHDQELHLSNGLTHRNSQSRIYTEAAYSFTKQIKGETVSDEYLNTQWSISLADIDVDQLFNETSHHAEHSLDVVKPDTGKYPVIIDAEVLATLMNGHVSLLSARNSYHGLPFVKIGDELIPGATGDLLTVTLDPTLEFGADTCAVSEQGIVQMPLPVVEKNRVIATCTDKRHADYLGIPTTSTRGNVVINAGTLSHEELTRQAPKVIEIVQFSGLFADPNSGTFASEIRLAKLYDNEKKTVTYLKGGSLSGSILQNFQKLKLSKDLVKKTHFHYGSAGAGYYGPSHALLGDVSIVG